MKNSRSKPNFYGIKNPFLRGDKHPYWPGLVFRNYDIGKLGQVIERWITEERAAKSAIRTKELCKKPERIKAQKKYTSSPRAKALARESAKNPERQKKLKEYMRFWTKRERRRNPNYRIQQNLYSRINEYLRKYSTSKQARSTEILGCSISEFRSHLEALFLDGMTWDNRGKWEIDHIRPIRLFDIRNTVELKAAFHYTNCRPLWKEDNARKSDFLPGLRIRARYLIPRRIKEITTTT
jgi:hypothetical protein